MTPCANDTIFHFTLIDVLTYYMGKLFFEAVHKIIVLFFALSSSLSLFLLPLFSSLSSSSHLAPISLLLSSFLFLPSYSNQYDWKLEEAQ